MGVLKVGLVVEVVPGEQGTRIMDLWVVVVDIRVELRGIMHLMVVVVVRMLMRSPHGYLPTV